MKSFHLPIVFLLFTLYPGIKTIAQSAEFASSDELIAYASQLHDSGDYKSAIQFCRKCLKPIPTMHGQAMKWR